MLSIIYEGVSMNEVAFELIFFLACVAGVCFVKALVLFFTVVELVMATDRFLISAEGKL